MRGRELYSVPAAAQSLFDDASRRAHPYARRKLKVGRPSNASPISTTANQNRNLENHRNFSK